MDEWKNFVTAQDLQSHWKVLPAELLDFIHSGQPAYRQTGILIESSELLPEKTLLDIAEELALRAARDSEARKCRSFITLANIPSSFDPRDFGNTVITKAPSPPPPTTTETLSDIHTEAKRVFEKLRKRKDNQTLTDLNTFLFNRDEINQFAQLHELKTINEVEAQPPQEIKPQKTDNLFQHENDFWTISFRGIHLGPIKHSDGMIYVANIISKGFIHASDLYETAHPKSSDEHIISNEEMKKALANEEMSVSNMNLTTLDPTSKEDYRKYILERRNIINDLYFPETERKKAAEEINALVTTLQKEYGRNPLSLDKTVRQNEIIKGDVDKVRKSIKKVIKTIYQHSPELANYLTEKIKYGTECRFIGDSNIWEIIV